MGAQRHFPLSERLQRHRLLRLGVLLLGAWTCGVAGATMLTLFHAGTEAWVSKFRSVVWFGTIGSGLGLVLALPMLWKSDVRKSVPFVWGTSLTILALAIVFESLLSRSSVLLWIPWAAIAACMFAARQLFPWPPRVAGAAADGADRP